MLAVWQLLDTVLGLYTFAVVISVVLTWLVQFNVVNTSNQFVYMVGDFLYRIPDMKQRLTDYRSADNSEIKLKLDELLADNCRLARSFHAQRCGS